MQKVNCRNCKHKVHCNTTSRLYGVPNYNGGCKYFKRRMGMSSCLEYVEVQKQELKKKIAKFNKKPVLAVIQVDNNAASNTYIKNKRRSCEEIGIECLHIVLNSEFCSQEDFELAIKDLNNEKKCTGIIIQLPIPDKYDVEKLQQCISPSKDVDGFRKDSCFEPCTPKGIMDWLDYNSYNLEGKNVVVIGRSKIVGKPLVNMMIDRGATVICCNSKTKDIRDFTNNADVVVSAIGKPKYFNATHFGDVDIIIDVGINRDENGKLCGDIDKENLNTWCPYTYVTPVPNGVGKLTVNALLENIVKAYELNN